MAAERGPGGALHYCRRMAERTPGGWHHHLEKAEFEELVWRGRVRFHGAGKRYRERVWPVFWRVRSPRQTTDAWHLRHLPLSQRIEAARRWWAVHPLTRQWDRVDEAITATRGTRA